MSAPILVRVTTSAVQATVLGQQTTDTSIRAAVSRALLQREEPRDLSERVTAFAPADATWDDLEGDLEILSQIGGAL